MATTGQTSFEISLAVYTQYRPLTDRQTDGQMESHTPHDGKDRDRAMQSVERAKVWTGLTREKAITKKILTGQACHYSEGGPTF